MSHENCKGCSCAGDCAIQRVRDELGQQLKKNFGVDIGKMGIEMFVVSSVLPGVLPDIVAFRFSGEVLRAMREGKKTVEDEVAERTYYKADTMGVLV